MDCIGRLAVGKSKCKVQKAKLRNPGLAGMGILVVASFSISRILYLLDVYYTSKAVGCQVNFNHGFRGFSRICISHRELGAASLRSAATKRDERRCLLVYGMDDKNTNRSEGATPWIHLYSVIDRMSSGY
jgi:hypothetical protein